MTRSACSSGCDCARQQPARRVLTRGVCLLGAPVIALCLGGVSYAYWAATATGTAEVRAATAQPLTVSAVAAPTATLYPGKTEDLSFTLANSNPYGVTLTTLTAVTVTSSDAEACPAESITLPATVTTAMAAGGYTLPSPISVAAGATGVPATLTGFVTMATSAPNGCQGKSFSFALTFSGSQV